MAEEKRPIHKEVFVGVVVGVLTAMILAWLGLRDGGGGGNFPPQPSPPDYTNDRPFQRVDGLWMTTGGQTYAFESDGPKVNFDGVDAYGYRIRGQGSAIGREIEAFYSRGDGSMGMVALTVSPDLRSMRGQATNITYGTVEPFMLSRK